MPWPALTCGVMADLAARGHSSSLDAYMQDKMHLLVHDSASLCFGEAALNAIDLCFARAREFPVPLLIIHGGADRIADSSGSEDFASLVRAAGKDVMLKLWDGLYHEVHNEPEKEEVFTLMIEWLDKHL